MIANFTFHHIGIATKSIEKCFGIYSALGYTMSDIKIEPSQNVKISFFSKEGSPLLELVEPLDKNAPISNIIQQSGTTPYHTCYEVEDIIEAIDALEDLNFRPLFEPKETEAMDEGLFCYLFSPAVGLIELYERKI